MPAAPDTAPRPLPSVARPTSAEIEAAVAVLRADPKLGGERKVRRLHWKDAQPEQPTPWLVALFEYLGQGMSLLMWVAGAIGIALLVVWLLRIFSTRRLRGPEAEAPAVNSSSLDLRPESLPADIGAAARELLDAGRSREALSLLYRGALSRAVHRFGLRIAEADTENDVLRAVAAGLDAPRARFVADLARLRQAAAYAGAPAPSERVLPLCTEFASTLGFAPAAGGPP